MKHTIRIEIENRTDLILAEAGVINPEHYPTDASQALI